MNNYKLYQWIRNNFDFRSDKDLGISVIGDYKYSANISFYKIKKSTNYMVNDWRLQEEDQEVLFEGSRPEAMKFLYHLCQRDFNIQEMKKIQDIQKRNENFEESKNLNKSFYGDLENFCP